MLETASRNELDPAWSFDHWPPPQGFWAKIESFSSLLGWDSLPQGLVGIRKSLVAKTPFDRIDRAFEAQSIALPWVARDAGYREVVIVTASNTVLEARSAEHGLRMRCSDWRFFVSPTDRGLSAAPKSGFPSRSAATKLCLRPCPRGIVKSEEKAWCDGFSGRRRLARCRFNTLSAYSMTCFVLVSVGRTAKCTGTRQVVPTGTDAHCSADEHVGHTRIHSLDPVRLAGRCCDRVGVLTGKERDMPVDRRCAFVLSLVLVAGVGCDDAPKATETRGSSVRSGSCGICASAERFGSGCCRVHGSNSHRKRVRRPCGPSPAFQKCPRSVRIRLRRASGMPLGEVNTQGAATRAPGLHDEDCARVAACRLQGARFAPDERKRSG